MDTPSDSTTGLQPPTPAPAVPPEPGPSAKTTSTFQPPPLPAPASLPPKNGWGQGIRFFALGVLSILILGMIAGYPVARYVYGKGKEKGAADEKENQASRTYAPNALVVPRDEGPEPKATITGVNGRPISGGATWLFGPQQCARMVWPMEIVPAAANSETLLFRIRQGVNRFTRPETGLCEFVFQLTEPMDVTVLAHCKYTDDCANSLNCAIDGLEAPLGDSKDYDRWIWERAGRRWRLTPGQHRVTIHSREDGLVFDRIAVVPVEAVRELSQFDLNALPVTEAPIFDRYPAVNGDLPEILGVEMSAAATGSLVLGKGHKNELTVRLRLNGAQEAAGVVVLDSQVGGFHAQRTFKLDPQNRTQLLQWDLELHPDQNAYYVPVDIRTYVGKTCVKAETLHFIRPLSWAFLGPFPDPEMKALDLKLPPESMLDSLTEMPPVNGATWKVVEDGSCYDDFGAVDFNKLYNLPTEHWDQFRKSRAKPQIVYAVTALNSFYQNHHEIINYAGDDCLQVWVNGVDFLRHKFGSPLETTLLTAATGMHPGKNVFVFKVPQTEFYWQLLFEPNRTLPYSHAAAFVGMPVRDW